MTKRVRNEQAFTPQDTEPANRRTGEPAKDLAGTPRKKKRLKVFVLSLLRLSDTPVLRFTGFL
jgi:hypothetical protein